MFEFDGKQYELKFNIQRIKMIEAAMKSSLMREWQNNNGMLSLQTIEFCFQFALKEAGSDIYVNQTEAVRISNEYMNKKGYAPVALLIQESLQEHMPFLFQAN